CRQHALESPLPSLAHPCQALSWHTLIPSTTSPTCLPRPLCEQPSERPTAVPLGTTSTPGVRTEHAEYARYARYARYVMYAGYTQRAEYDQTTSDAPPT